MSSSTLRHRLSRLVRAELHSVEQRLRDLMGGAPGSRRPEQPAPPPADPSQEQRIAACYANLELPPGASLEQVKQAYRRMLSRYHPDRHANDPEKQAVANEVSMQLRQAYDTLVAHLERKGS